MIYYFMVRQWSSFLQGAFAPGTTLQIFYYCKMLFHWAFSYVLHIVFVSRQNPFSNVPLFYFKSVKNIDFWIIETNLKIGF